MPVAPERIACPPPYHTRHRPQRHHHGHRREEPLERALDVSVDAEDLLVRIVELPVPPVFLDQALHRPDTAYGLAQNRVESTHPVSVLVEHGPKHLPEPGPTQHEDRNREEDEERQFPIQHQQDDCDGHEGEQVDDEVRDTVHHEVLQLPGVVHHPSDELSGLVAVVV